MALGPLLAEQLRGTRDWTLKLLADIADDGWYFQPAPGLAHPLWLCGHLAASQNTLVHVRCLGRSVLGDDFATHFPIAGPVKSAAEHVYPLPAEVREIMDEVHTKTFRAVCEMSDALLSEPAFAKDGALHPHYRDKRGAVTHCFRHEAFHAGQLALLRRLLGKPFLR